MAKNRIVFALLLFLILGISAGTYRDGIKESVGIRQQLQALYTAEIGVKEATGRNDGKRVSEYLAYVGLGPGHEWCAAFVCYNLGKANIDNPKNPWSPALFPNSKVVWIQEELAVQKGKGNRENVKARSPPKTGSVFGLYFAEKKRIAHVGFVDKWEGNWCITVEGNVDNRVLRKRRPQRTLYKVVDFIQE